MLAHVSSSFYVVRIQKATESLRTFHPSADPCFDEFVLDTSREETLLKEMCFGGGTTDFVINYELYYPTIPTIFMLSYIVPLECFASVSP